MREERFFSLDLQTTDDDQRRIHSSEKESEREREGYRAKRTNRARAKRRRADHQKDVKVVWLKVISCKLRGERRGELKLQEPIY